MSHPRIVSLLPSATEIVCALERTGHLVGRSHVCDYPPEIRHLPVCTSPKLSLAGSSLEIDRAIHAQGREGVPLYHLDRETITRLRPDLILTQSQCAVCAVNLEEVNRVAQECFDQPPRILSLAPSRLTDVWSDILGVADELGVAGRGKELVNRLKTRVVDVIEKSCQVKARPPAACIEWIDPLMAAGNWVPELVELAGGLDLFGEPGKHSNWLNWEAIREHNPDILVLMPCGFDLEKTRQETRSMTQRPDWLKLRAVKKGQVYLTDGRHYFNRPGPRLVDSLEILAEIFHPDIFDFGRRTKGWDRFM